MKTFYWSTQDEHANNDVTMDDYLENYLPDGFEVIVNDGTYAEIRSASGKVFSVSASGNGDFRNHKVEFEKLTS